MAIIIGSQLDASDNAALRALPARPIVIEAPQDAPWQLASEADVLLVRPTPPWRGAPDAVPPEWPGKLRWIFSVTSGMDLYPDWIYRAPAVTCGRGLADDEIADYVIAAIYRQGKDIDGATARSPADWTPRALGRVLGSTVGLIGFGAIAQAIARRALALGADVVAARNSGRPSDIAGVHILADVAEVAVVSDHLVLAVPATSATRALIDAAVLRQVKPGAHLINIARGSVLDQAALLDALDGGRLGFATLDVTDPEPLPEGHRLWTHPRVRLTPHISNNATAGRPKLIAKFASDLERLLRSEEPTDLVNPVLGY